MAGFMDALRGFFAVPASVDPMPYGRGILLDERSLYQSLWGAGLDDLTRGNTAAGEQVDIHTAFTNIAFQAAVRLLANDVASLPVDSYRNTPEGKKEIGKPTWVTLPNPNNPNETWDDHVKQVVVSMLTDGNAFIRCFPSVYLPTALQVYDPTDVDIVTVGRDTFYDVKGVGRLTPQDLIHIPWLKVPGKARGLDPISAAKEGLGVALAADKFVGAYFGNGAVLSGVIEYPIGVEPTKDQTDELVKSFSRKHVGARKSHAVGALTGGGAYKPFPYNNREAQLLELRDSIVEEVARLIGIPPHMLGSQKPGAVGYASVEQRSIDYVTHAVLPICKRFETGYSRLLRGPDTYLRFNVRGLLRGDEAARAAYYTSLLNNKIMRRDEARQLEDLPFDADAVGYLETPNNNAPEPSGPAPAPVTNNAWTFPDGFVRNETTVPTTVTVPITVEPGAVPDLHVDARTVVAEGAVQNHAAPITVESPVTVTVPEQRAITRTVKRDAKGLIESIEEVPGGE